MTLHIDTLATTDIDQLIAIYLSGELTSAESKELKAWIDASEENRKHFLDMQEVWFSTVSDKDGKRFDKDAAYRLFLAKTTKRSNYSTKRLWRHAMGAAAAVVVAVVVSLFAYRQGGNQVKNQFADITIEAPNGSRTKLFLPDGTSVWLNAGSKITYSQGFAVSERKVRLSGEGYFEVTRNEELPMEVITDELSVTVLGTTFNFRNYPDEEEIVVSLEKGKILSSNLLRKEQKFTLAPDEKVTMNKRTRMMTLSAGSAKNLSGWIDGNLFFDEKLLPDIIQTLERSYNVQIRLTDPSLRDFRFYGQFSRTENTVQDVLDKLVATNRVEYLMDGDEIILMSKR
jgi:ferric-dicitrate binding protein FerR (iron transport regulator)